MLIGAGWRGRKHEAGGETGEEEAVRRHGDYSKAAREVITFNDLY